MRTDPTSPDDRHGGSPGRAEPATGTVETAPGWRSWRARPVGGSTRGGTPQGAEWAAWGWSGGGRSFPWVGIFVVLLGLALLIQQLRPGISLTSLVLLALGIGFGTAWVVGRLRGAFVPAAVLVALAAARLGGELGYLAGSGWTALFLGVAFGLIWAVGRLQGARRDWSLWVGAVLAVIGLVQASGRIPGLPELGLLWPLVIIAVGGVMLLRARMTGLDRKT